MTKGEEETIRPRTIDTQHGPNCSAQSGWMSPRGDCHFMNDSDGLLNPDGPRSEARTVKDLRTWWHLLGYRTLKRLGPFPFGQFCHRDFGEIERS